MPKYEIWFTETVDYMVEVICESSELEDHVDEIIDGGNFDALSDCQLVTERVLGEIVDEEGNIYDDVYSVPGVSDD